LRLIRKTCALSPSRLETKAIHSPSGAEARPRLALLARREPQRLAAVERRQVDVGVGRVLLQVGGRDRVGDEAAVRAQPGIGHVLEGEQVGDAERTLVRVKRRDEQAGQGGDQERLAEKAQG
jgi:hypothetical protein